MAPDPRTVAATPVTTGRGACFGFAVRSALDFTFLRRETGAEDPLPVTVRQRERPPPGGPPLMSWEATPARPFHARLYGAGGRFRYWISTAGWFDVDTARPEITVPPDLDPVQREERVWGMPAVLCFMTRGDVPLHAAAVELPAGALLVAAPGRYGKTTLAAAFLAAGYRVLAEDMTCCRPGPEPTVLPGPALLRLRRDVGQRLAVPGARRLPGDDGRIRLAHTRGRRGHAGPVPLRGLVFLRPGSRLDLSRVPPMDALPDLWALSFRLPTAALRAQRFGDLVGLADRVPVWNLTRPEGLERLPAVVERLAALPL